MKKYFLLIIMILCFPICTLAMDASETFAVGDDVSVSFNGSTNYEDWIGFHVLKASAANEQYVTLIYDGALVGSPAEYDISTGDDHLANVNYATSFIKTKVDAGIAANGWVVQEARLLSKSDLDNLGLTTSIPAKYSFLAPIQVAGIEENKIHYWTAIPDTTKTDLEGNVNAIYVMYLNEEHTPEGEWATLKSYEIDKLGDEADVFTIRPVVVVDKAYIMCNNSKQNPKTGLEDYIIPLSGALIVSLGAVLISRKKEVFKNL